MITQSPNLLNFRNFCSSGYDEQYLKNPEIVIVDNEPLIKVYVKNAKPEIFSFERLWNLDSNILDSLSLQGMNIFESIIKERARRGQELILEIWTKEGYSVPELSEYSKDKIVLGTLIPALKKPEKTSKGKKAHTSIMKFTQEDDTFYWALIIKETKTVIGKALWNDYAGLERLANTCIDRESVEVVFSLTDPKAALKLVEGKQRKSTATSLENATKRYFGEAIFSTADKATIKTLLRKYNQGLTSACQKAKGIERKNRTKPLLGFNHDVFSSEPKLGEVGLYTGRLRDIVELQFLLGINNKCHHYSRKTPIYKKTVREYERALWANFKKDAATLGFTIVEATVLPGIPYDKKKSLSNLYSFLFVFRSFKVIKNVEKHAEVFKNNKTANDLHAYVAKKNKANATQPAKANARKTSR